MINRTTTNQFTKIAFRDTWKHYVLPVKKEVQVKTTMQKGLQSFKLGYLHIEKTLLSKH